MNVERHSQEQPVRPQIEINTIASELEARRQEDERLVLEDVEFRDWVDGPADEDGDTQEPLARKLASNVKTPTKLEIEDHEKLHLPFRTWCSACVKGRGVASPHSSICRDDPAAPEIFLDYCFPRAKVTILGIKHGPSGATASMLVSKKGGSIAWVSKHIKNLIDYEWGMTKIIMKSDGEPAIKDLKNLIKAQRMKDQTIMEESPSGESQSNGKAENAIREIEGMIRTWKEHLESKYGVKIDIDNPIFPWLVRFAGEIITRFKKGADGLVPYERLKIKKPRSRGAQLGEKILFMPVKDVKNKKDKLDP